VFENLYDARSWVWLQRPSGFPVGVSRKRQLLMDYPGDENEQGAWGSATTPKQPQVSGADYLRSLKRDPKGAAPTQPAAASNLVAPPEQPPSTFPGQRREHSRFPCQGSAQVKVGGSTFSSWGTISDISLGGCYLEITATIPQETILHMNLEVNGIRFRAKGNVRATYPMLGAGVRFVEISPEDRARLEELIGALATSAKAHVP